MLGGAKLALASGSPRRLALLQQIGLEPDTLIPASIDETPGRSERPRSLAVRLASAKAHAGAKRLAKGESVSGSYVLAADTVVAIGRRVFGKPENAEEARANLAMLSGRTHRVYTALVLLSPSMNARRRVIETRVQFKKLSRREIESYLQTGEWRGKSGGYAIQGIAGAFVSKIIGSYSNVVGLPLYETMNLLQGAGFQVSDAWTNQQIQ